MFICISNLFLKKIQPTSLVLDVCRHRGIKKLLKAEIHAIGDAAVSQEDPSFIVMEMTPNWCLDFALTARCSRCCSSNELYSGFEGGSRGVAV